MPKIQEKIETTLFFCSLNILIFYRHDFLILATYYIKWIYFAVKYY